MEFGGVFKALRQKRGLTQEEFAEELNVNQSDISKFENDDKLPDLHLFRQMILASNAPEVAVAFMFGMDGVGIIQNVLQMMGGFILWF